MALGCEAWSQDVESTLLGACIYVDNGLNNDETPEDSWETIQLIPELETEQPDSRFTVTL